MEEHTHQWERNLEPFMRYECKLCFAEGRKKQGLGMPIEVIPDDAIEELSRIVRFWEVSDVWIDDMVEKYIPNALLLVDDMRHQLAEAKALLHRELHIPTYGMTPEQMSLVMDIIAFLGDDARPDAPAFLAHEQ